MRDSLSPLQEARESQEADQYGLERLATNALQRANSNAGRNTYLQFDRSRATNEIVTFKRGGRDVSPALSGIPISIKDCFDVRDYRTSCGSRFYNECNLPASDDSWITAQVRRAGGILIGKSHMQQLAYGITGENADFDDCLQPDDASLLTGGSSSGAAASIQEGSALVAVGTDTGGSIRLPAALCGIAGYRSSLGVGSWQGGVHLAPSFDTLGFLFRDLRDGPRLAKSLFGVASVAPSSPRKDPRVAFVPEDFLHDCDALVREAFTYQQERLLELGADLHRVDTKLWADSIEIFAAIQAHEAAAIQRQKLAGRADFSVFEPRIAERLAWGESLQPAYVEQMRKRLVTFRASMDAMLAEYDFLILPCAPMHRLQAHSDHSRTRQQILRYTTPASLAGMPVVTLPQPSGAGVQLIAARGCDSELLAYAASLYANISD